MLQNYGFLKFVFVQMGKTWVSGRSLRSELDLFLCQWFACQCGGCALSVLQGLRSDDRSSNVHRVRFVFRLNIDICGNEVLDIFVDPSELRLFVRKIPFVCSGMRHGGCFQHRQR